MDANRGVRPTGRMMEQLPPQRIPQNEPTRQLKNVPGDGDCLYLSLARMYEFTVEWPLGNLLQTRMQVVAEQYSPGANSSLELYIALPFCTHLHALEPLSRMQPPTHPPTHFCALACVVRVLACSADVCVFL